MQLHTPLMDLTDGEFHVYINASQPDKPFGVIELGSDTRIFAESDEDCDRLIRAADRIKKFRARYGTQHEWQPDMNDRNCEFCGAIKKHHDR